MFPYLGPQSKRLGLPFHEVPGGGFVEAVDHSVTQLTGDLGKNITSLVEGQTLQLTGIRTQLTGDLRTNNHLLV